MGRITSNIGLATGIPIVETVDQLMALQARPRDLLQSLNKKVEAEQVAVTDVSAKLLGLQIALRRLSQPTLFNQRSATSSNTSTLTATASGGAALGTYQFTPFQTAQAQQLISSSFASRTAPLASGSFALRFGGFVDTNTRLDITNGGVGLQRGSLRITDRSGATADIDLSLARDVNDVLQAINGNTTLSVRAEVHGDRLRIVDLTGQTNSNLIVQDIGGGTTAASLGLAGINVASSSADGQDIVRLFDELSLDKLNDGNGVRFDTQLPDLTFTFRDGSDPLSIDFHRVAQPGTLARTTTTAVNPDARIQFTAVQGGSEYAGVRIVFEDDAAITFGSETVRYDDSDPGDKKLIFSIDAGHTNANAVVQALSNNAEVSKLFKAELASGVIGLGKITVNDTGITTGPPATATTPGTNGSNAQVTFTAVQGGEAFDGVTVVFQHNAGLAAGQESVVYDDSDPDNKTLVFQINENVTTANRIISLTNNDATVGTLFRASRPTATNGTGLISASDTAVTSGGAIVEPVKATKEATLGELLQVINAADPTRLRAEIAPDGDRLQLIDLTDDLGGTFSVSSINQSHAARDLGLLADADGDTITGGRILAGLNTSLLRSLDGGSGVGQLGEIEITDRSGASAVVDLAAAETLSDVIGRINDAGLGVQARINDARNGLVLIDTTGSTASNLIVASVDPGVPTAEKLGLVVDAAVTKFNSGDLHRQMMSTNTKLSTLNGGGGVANGSFTIVDSAGQSATLNLQDAASKTVGDVIKQINQLGIGVRAQVNLTGDGILLVDTAGGSSAMSVAAGGSSTAADLHLLGEQTEIEIDGQLEKVIDGSMTLRVEFDGNVTLDDLVSKINNQFSGVKASVFNDGALVNPFRISLVSERTGAVSELLFDTSQAGFSLNETAKARDALLLFGESNVAGIIASSSTNTFRDLVGGVTLTLQATSTTPVSVTVGASDTNLVAALETFVESYNTLRTRMSELTAFNSETNESGVLLGDGTMLRVESDLLQVLSGAMPGVGSIRTLQTVGITLQEDGTLEFDKAKFEALYASDPAGVEGFFSTPETGLADRLNKVIVQLAAKDDALLINRLDALTRTLFTNDARIEDMNKRLDASRERLLREFIRMEQVISEMQNQLNVINSIQQIQPLSFQRRR